MQFSPEREHVKMQKTWLIRLSRGCKDGPCDSRELSSRLQLTTTKPKRGIWSHHKSQELLCHRNWRSRGEEKLAGNQWRVTVEVLKVGGDRTNWAKRDCKENWQRLKQKRESVWNKEIQKRELSAKGVRVVALEERERERRCWRKEVKDIFSGSGPSWCLCWTATGVRSLFQPWRQL